MMKRYSLSLHDVLLTLIAGLLFIGSLATGAYGQTSMSTRRSDSLYYKPEHFVWAHVENDRLQRKNLLFLLPRHHIVIVLDQPTEDQKRDILTFLQTPPATIPEISAYKTIMKGLRNTDRVSPRQFEAFASQDGAQSRILSHYLYHRSPHRHDPPSPHRFDADGQY